MSEACFCGHGRPGSNEVAEQQLKWLGTLVVCQEWRACCGCEPTLRLQMMLVWRESTLCPVNDECTSP